MAATQASHESKGMGPQNDHFEFFIYVLSVDSRMRGVASMTYAS